MPKAVRIPTRVTTLATSSEKSESSPLISIAIFCGIGLLVSLIAMLSGVQGVWS